MVILCGSRGGIGGEPFGRDHRIVDVVAMSVKEVWNAIRWWQTDKMSRKQRFGKNFRGKRRFFVHAPVHPPKWRVHG